MKSLLTRPLLLLVSLCTLMVLFCPPSTSIAADMPLLRDDTYVQWVDIDLLAEIYNPWSYFYFASDQDDDYVEEDSLALLPGVISECWYGTSWAQITCQGVAECKTPPSSAFLQGECITFIGGLLEANSGGYYEAATVGSDSEAKSQADFVVQAGPQKEETGTMTIEFDLDAMGSIPLYAGTLYLEVAKFNGTDYDVVASAQAVAAGGLWEIDAIGPDLYVDESEFDTLWNRTYFAYVAVAEGDRFRLRSRTYEHIQSGDNPNTAYDGGYVSQSHEFSAVVSISVQSD